MKYTFNKQYLIYAVLLFLIEVVIALFFHDAFVRPFLGDVLVVMLLYCCIRIVVPNQSVKWIVFVVAFAFVVEVLQYFNLVKLLGLQHNQFANIIIGNSFDSTDLLAYSLGGLVSYFFLRFKS